MNAERELGRSREHRYVTVVMCWMSCVLCLLWMLPMASGCRTAGKEAAAPETLNQQVTPVLVPHSIVSGRPMHWHVLPPEQVREILNQPLPPPTAETRGLTLEEVVERITGKKIFYVPMWKQFEEDADDAIEGETHESQWVEDETYESRYPDLKGHTVGRYLQGLISSSTEMAGPRLRMLNTDYVHYWQVADEVRDAIPRLMEVLFVTDNYILVIAVPNEADLMDKREAEEE